MAGRQPRRTCAEESYRQGMPCNHPACAEARCDLFQASNVCLESLRFCILREHRCCLLASILHALSLSGICAGAILRSSHRAALVMLRSNLFLQITPGQISPTIDTILADCSHATISQWKNEPGTALPQRRSPCGCRLSSPRTCAATVAVMSGTNGRSLGTFGRAEKAEAKH